MSPRELILAQFPGRLQISIVEAGIAIGLSKGTVYNMNSLSTLPFRVRHVGMGKKKSKPVVALTDLIAYLEDEAVAKAEAPADEKLPGELVNLDAPRRPGRPTKAAQRAREDALRRRH